MLHIAICDDETVEINYLSDLIRTWASSNSLDITLASFNSAESFLFTYEDMAPLDILLLDIQMGAMDGMTLAKHLRKSNDNVHIIFITGYQDFVAEGYDVSALHYLMKPVKPERLFAVLDKAAASANILEDELIVQTAEGVIKVAHKDIIYVEAFAHYIQIHSKAKLLETRANIGDIAQTLGNGFAHCHRSYIVGLRHICHITKTEIILDNGAKIPISRRLHKDISQAFVKYHRGE